MKKGIIFIGQLLMVVMWVGIQALAAEGYDIDKGPTGLTIEVPSAGTGHSGDKDRKVHVYDDSEYLSLNVNHSDITIMGENASISLLKGFFGLPTGFAIDTGQGPIAIMLDSPTITADLPSEFAPLRGARTKPFMTETFDLLDDLVELDMAEPPTMASTYRLFLFNLIYIANAESAITTQDINDLVDSWQDLNVFFEPPANGSNR